MEFSSIWYFSLSSLISLLFLTTGVYFLDKAAIPLPHWFKHEIQECIASSVIYSMAYAFLFRPPLEHQELNVTRKLFDFYGLIYPQLIKSMIFLFFPFYAFPKVNLISAYFSLPVFLCTFCWVLMYLKTIGNGNGNGNLLSRIAGQLLLYPRHTLCWISFNVFLFFSLCFNFEDKCILIFAGGECLSIWGLHSYFSSVLTSISVLGITIVLKSFWVPRSPILIYAYEQRKMLEITVGMIFVVLAQYFSREKSVPLMFAFMSFAITWLGNIANVQPRTDLGIFHFFVSSSLECALSLFGLHAYTFLVLFGCIVLEILRWKIESVSLRHTGLRQSVFLDLVSLGQPRSTNAGVAPEEAEPTPE